MLSAGGAQMVYHLMSEDDVARILKHPQVAIASDARSTSPAQDATHPRAYGNNARVLGHYVREDKAITLEEAIRKMTSLPAEHFGFADRGLIKEGYAADLVALRSANGGGCRDVRTPHAYPMGCRTSWSTACSWCVTGQW